jgi:phytoene synthase
MPEQQTAGAAHLANVTEQPFGNDYDPLATVSAMMHERCDAAHCRGMIRTGSRSFYLASHLLPAELRQATYALYAFCREADDAIDGGADPFVGLSVFQRRLAGVYSEHVPESAVDRALARVVRHYAMPRELLEALLQGFAWDAQARSFKNLAGVHCYSVRVAGSVGIAMGLLMGVRDPSMLARAADLGGAMQLTNIARDVGEDARNGRIYLPRRWLREEGISAAELLAEPRFSPALGRVINHLLAAAEQLYRRADSGIAGLPKSCRPGIHAARLLYSEIGHELQRRGGDSVSSRTVVPRMRKMRLMARALRAPALCEEDLAAPPLPQVRYLLRAVDALPQRHPVAPAPGARAGWNHDVDWVLDMFAELERRDREAEQTIIVPINRFAAFERAVGSGPSVARSG